MKEPNYLITVDIIDLNSSELTDDGPRLVRSLRHRVEPDTIWTDLEGLRDMLQASVTDDIASYEREAFVREQSAAQDKADNDLKSIRENG